MKKKTEAKRSPRVVKAPPPKVYTGAEGVLDLTLDTIREGGGVVNDFLDAAHRMAELHGLDFEDIVILEFVCKIFEATSETDGARRRLWHLASEVTGKKSASLTVLRKLAASIDRAQTRDALRFVAVTFARTDAKLVAGVTPLRRSDSTEAFVYRFETELITPRRGEQYHQLRCVLRALGLTGDALDARLRNL